MLSGYVFLCVDNIDLRRQIAESFVGNPNIRAFFDFRMRLTDAQHFAADWSDERMDGHPSYRTVKIFKGRQNEQNAIGFIEDSRNLRVHGYMFLEMFDEEGKHFTWNEDRRAWEGDRRPGHMEVLSDPWAFTSNKGVIFS